MMLLHVPVSSVAFTLNGSCPMQLAIAVHVELSPLMRMFVDEHEYS